MSWTGFAIFVRRYINELQRSIARRGTDRSDSARICAVACDSSRGCEKRQRGRPDADWSRPGCCSVRYKSQEKGGGSWDRAGPALDGGGGGGGLGGLGGKGSGEIGNRGECVEDREGEQGRVRGREQRQTTRRRRRGGGESGIRGSWIVCVRDELIKELSSRPCDHQMRLLEQAEKVRPAQKAGEGVIGRVLADGLEVGQCARWADGRRGQTAFSY